MNLILAGSPLDLASLKPHLYYNNPDKVTGAQLPQGGNYTTQYVRSPGAAAGTARIITEAGGSVYYSNNHYQSFYPEDIVRENMDYISNKRVIEVNASSWRSSIDPY